MYCVKTLPQPQSHFEGNNSYDVIVEEPPKNEKKIKSKEIPKSIVYETIWSPNSSALHVAVIFGGLSAERSLSLKTANHVIQTLKDLGYTITPIDMNRDISYVLQTLQPDVVFNALHGTYGHDGCMAGILEVLEIPYTHCGIFGGSIATLKHKTLELATLHGIKSAKRVVVRKADRISVEPMPRPFVIKPISEGWSHGVFAVFDEDVFDISSYDYPYGWSHGVFAVFDEDTFDISSYDYPYGDILVEEYLKGIEIDVAIFNDKAVGTMESVITDRAVLDHEAKVNGLADYFFPARLSEIELQKVMELGEIVHKALDIGCISRPGFIYKKEEGLDGFYLLEINTNPGLVAGDSFYPQILDNAGISYQQLIDGMIKHALKKAEILL
uniref:ATP-grasp domain-containing protein n=1 Tax=Panagrolaimus sp. ES5 TaxID=591445 RepID=A0AC34FHS5_9BILA